MHRSSSVPVLQTLPLPHLHPQMHLFPPPPVPAHLAAQQTWHPHPIAFPPPHPAHYSTHAHLLPATLQSHPTMHMQAAYYFPQQQMHPQTAPAYTISLPTHTPQQQQQQQQQRQHAQSLQQQQQAAAAASAAAQRAGNYVATYGLPTYGAPPQFFWPMQ